MKEKILKKIIRFLENEAILLKRSTWKTNSQERGIFNFLALLTRFALPLTKTTFTSLAKKNLRLIFYP